MFEIQAKLGENNTFVIEREHYLKAMNNCYPKDFWIQYDSGELRSHEHMDISSYVTFKFNDNGKESEEKFEYLSNIRQHNQDSDSFMDVFENGNTVLRISYDYKYTALELEIEFLEININKEEQNNSIII